MAKFKFRLVAGKHYEGFSCPTCKGAKKKGDDKCATCDGFGRVHRECSRGDIIETDRNLMAMFNSQGSIKFERADGLRPEDRRDGETAKQYAARLAALAAEAALAAAQEEQGETATYEQMTVDELKRHAAAEEIDLGNAKSKQEIIKVLAGSKVHA
jgi:hypothetical protein